LRDIDARRLVTIDLHVNKEGNVSIVARDATALGTADEVDGWLLDAAYTIIRESERIAALISQDSRRSWLSRLLKINQSVGKSDEHA